MGFPTLANSAGNNASITLFPSDSITNSGVQCEGEIMVHKIPEGKLDSMEQDAGIRGGCENVKWRMMSHKRSTKASTNTTITSHEFTNVR